MSEDQDKSDSDVERVKRKVDRIYENYGIDPKGMDDGDLSSVYNYYLENKEELDNDYRDSQAHASKFDDDDII